jgi:4-hydroxy-4-methyl-2-oxoglutarate aldolase
LYVASGNLYFRSERDACIYSKSQCEGLSGPKEMIQLDPLIDAVRHLSASTLHEAAARRGALPCNIRPLDPARLLVGRAFPVSSSPGSNLALHHAITAASSGDVLVVDVGDKPSYGYWGEVMTVAAQARGIAGLVLNGCVRDARRIVELGFPTFARGTAIRGTEKQPIGSSVGQAIALGSVNVDRGDLVLGDGDGVVVIPWTEAPAIIAAAVERDAAERRYFEQLRAGASTVDIYHLEALTPPPPSISARRRSIDVSGLGHGHLPIPAASRVGGLVATGGVRGIDRQTGQMPENAVHQAQLMFANLRSIVEAAGAAMEDIVKLTIWVADADARRAINDPWTALFPDSESRPARHILNYQLPAGMRVQCEALAIVANCS